MHTTRPREHANRIARLETLAERQQAISEVPKAYQAMVKTHLCIIFRNRKAEREQWQKR
ncbi:hypothetical protein [Psychromonas sp. psych-6C06]|uniref:hypothetical protein n=1 Tax=Psychromonas sp. psych-6C06 TaxID=2058089 RepID=UPI00187CF610|nr:hypothetical protein [Psychromonas sp. psych-6C06]